MISDLTHWLMWAVYAARIAFCEQTTTLRPAMIRIKGEHLSFLLLTLLVVAASPVALAHERGQPGASIVDRSATAKTHRDGLTLDEAVSRAEAQYKARVVRTEVQDEDGRKVYVLKLLSEDGRVFTVRIDAATGRMR